MASRYTALVNKNAKYLGKMPRFSLNMPKTKSQLYFFLYTILTGIPQYILMIPFK